MSRTRVTVAGRDVCDTRVPTLSLETVVEVGLPHLYWGLDLHWGVFGDKEGRAPSGRTTSPSPVGRSGSRYGRRQGQRLSFWVLPDLRIPFVQLLFPP